MSKGSENTGSTGRFGPRYGVRIRRRIRDIEEEQRQDHRCPGCGAEKVSREAAGIWRCDKCDHKFAGGAYTPETSSYRTSQRQLKEALADEESDFEEEPEGDQVLDESETVAPTTPGATEEPEPEAEEADDEAVDEEDDELSLDDEVPEVDVPELEDIPEVEGLDEPEDVAEVEEPDEDLDPEADEADDDVVPEADLDLDRDEDDEEEA